MAESHSIGIVPASQLLIRCDGCDSILVAMALTQGYEIAMQRTKEKHLGDLLGKLEAPVPS